MSSNGEFSTMSSEEVPSLPKSLPSSREATAEGSSGSSGGYMPLREFLDRFSLPRVVRLEGAGGRPVLLYKQQQRSLRVTATLLIHRYRHDVKVGPEIVIPEGYPGELSFHSLGNDKNYRWPYFFSFCGWKRSIIFHFHIKGLDRVVLPTIDALWRRNKFTFFR